MEYTSTKVKAFTDLRAWQESHQLAIAVYKATEAFPESQRFGLTNQLQRAVVSIPSNIAEGFGRQTLKDQINFLYIAIGSLNEVKSQLMIGKDLGYLPNDQFEALDSKIVAISKMLHGLIKSLKSRQQ